MPLYDYNCEGCSKPFESLSNKLLTSDEERAQGLLPKCPHCGSDQVARGISKSTHAVFKGSGFHVNDYPKRRRR